MIAVIVLPGPSSKMLGLDAGQSLALLPLGDRPFLQHMIESLVAQRITSLEILTEHGPEKVETLLGNGDRWGCHLRYHLISELKTPYRSLRVIGETRSDSWLLIHAAQYPLATFSEVTANKPTVFYAPEDTGGVQAWSGTALFPAGEWGDCLSEFTADRLEHELDRMLADSVALKVTVKDWIDASSPEALLDSQARLLNKTLKGTTISGIERQRGVWISRNVAIHRGVQLIAPVYIGPDSRISRNAKLGPETVIAGSCIIDSNTTVEHSLVLTGTYVGAGLELNKAIVDRDLLVNVELGTSINVFESFLLGGLTQRPRQNWLVRGFRALGAFLLILMLLPISLLSMLYYALTEHSFPTTIEIAELPLKKDSPLPPPGFFLPCLGRDAWRIHRPAGWGAFLRQFLPGLYAILLGRIAFVGLPPRKPEDLQHLPSEWRALYHESDAGLITEASVAAAQEDDTTQLYLSDAYYVAKQSLRHDVGLVFKYFSCLFKLSPKTGFAADES